MQSLPAIKCYAKRSVKRHGFSNRLLTLHTPWEKQGKERLDGKTGVESGQRLALVEDREWGEGLAGHRQITVGRM